MYEFNGGNLESVQDYGSQMEQDNARFAQEMQKLQASNQYRMASINEQAKMEAQLLAMREGYLPAPMAQSLIGVPNSPVTGQPVGEPGVSGLGMVGGIAGGVSGYLGRGAIGQGLTDLGTSVTAKGSVGNIANDVLKSASQGVRQGTASAVNKLSPKVSNSVLQKLLQGAGKAGIDASVGLANLGSSVAGKGSATKGIGALLGKVGGGVASKGIAGAAIGGIPGFLVGTAIGAVIEGLLNGDEKDRAKAEFMLNQYR